MITGTLTLDGGGSASSTWVIIAGTTLVTATNSSVVLVRGALAKNVQWVVGSSATLGTYSSFSGSILANVSITATTGVPIHSGTATRSPIARPCSSSRRRTTPSA